MKEIRAVSAVLKSLGTFRKELKLEDAEELCSLLPLEGPALPAIKPEVESKFRINVRRWREFGSIVEIQAVLHLFYVMKLYEARKGKEALELSGKLVGKLRDINRRTLDSINARAYYFYALSCELMGQLQSRRGEFYAAYRAACLRIDQITQATILNILVRSYINENEYELARNLTAKVNFPETVSNSQFARYLYYNGRIKAIQLEYSEAENRLVQASRKAPQSSAKGFRIQVLKLKTIVELLTGAIPERNVFSQSDLRKPLFPYYLITQSVRAGNLKGFAEVVDRYASVFMADRNYTLIQRYVCVHIFARRLRHNVIKFGLRKIFLSYSRISLADICSKLHLESVDETEYIVAKAIRDGVIDATINHEEQYLQTKVRHHPLTTSNSSTSTPPTSRR